MKLHALGLLALATTLAYAAPLDDAVRSLIRQKPEIQDHLSGAECAAIDPKLCATPYEEICASPITQGYLATAVKVQKASLELSAQARGTASMSRWLTDVVAPALKHPEAKGSTEILTAYVKYFNELMDRAFKDAAVSEAQFQKHYGEIQAALVSEVDSQPRFRDAKPSLVPAISAKILRTPLYSARKLKLPPDADELSEFATDCGSDGMENFAGYSPDDGYVVFCPGAVIQAVASGGLDSLDFELGHELSHVVDTTAEIQGSTPRQMEKSYEGFLGCVLGGDVAGFHTIEQKRDYLRDVGVPALTKELARLRAADPQDENAIYWAKRYLDDAPADIEELEADIVDVDESFPPKATMAEAYSEELVADYWGAKVLGQRLASASSADRPRILRSALYDFCPATLGAMAKLSRDIYQTDGRHPPGRHRIQEAFDEPVTRATLGCDPLIKTRCSPESSVPKTAR